MRDIHQRESEQIFRSLDLWDYQVTDFLYGKRHSMSFGQWRKRRRQVRKLEDSLKARGII